MAGTCSSSGEEAVNVALDRRYFVLTEQVFEEFKAMLEESPKDNPKLRRLLESKAPWER